MSTPIDPASFAWLLRRHRLAAGLTQEELAERAHLSARAISDLERGLKHTPRRDTIALLAEALALAAPDRLVLERAARPPLAPAETAPPAVLPAAVADAPGAGTTGSLPASTRTSLPTGILTFLLTDIVESTALWDRHPVAMHAAIARHDALVEEALARHGGHQVKERGEGDSIFAVFVSPGAALAAAVAAQQALLAESWPLPRPLQVRMGLHTGEAAQEGIGYYGVAVNRTARIRSLAHGGQILVSHATAGLVSGALPAGTALRHLGAYSLKGLAQPEPISQVVHPDLPADFPPLAGTPLPRHNLPAPMTSFVGRMRELAEITALLTRSRLVTLTGIGGAGKTRLALRLAVEHLDVFADGVWVAALSTLTDAAQASRQVAMAVGLRDEPGRSITETLIDHFASRQALLVLDNCEHLLDAVASLAATLLRACPALRLLATSREELSVAGEAGYRVPPLALPTATAASPTELGGSEAVQLFVERARARKQDFQLTPRNAPAVVRICARLEGVPLAIELAAARVGVMPIDAIADRLDDALGLLAGKDHAVERRQQTLRAALDWSYDLLTEDERRLLRRLAVFAGGWDLDAAEVLTPDPSPQGRGENERLLPLSLWERGLGGEGQILDLLDSLVRKSLVVLDEECARYRLLETVRQYALERLETAGEVVIARDRHLDWCLALSARAEPALMGAEQRGWLVRLDAEHENLRAALTWCRRAPARAADGARLASRLWRFWAMRGYLGEGRDWLEGFLAMIGGDAAREERAGALRAAGRLALEQSDLSMAQRWFEESLAIARALGDTSGAADSLHYLGHAAREQGDGAGAETLYAESLALRRTLRDSRGIATALQCLGDIALARGEYTRARDLYEQSLDPARKAGDQSNSAWILHQLGLVALEEGRLDLARALLDESLTTFQDLRETPGIIAALHRLGRLRLDAGETRRARDLLAESLRLAMDANVPRGIADALDGLAVLLSRSGLYTDAARLLGASEALRKEAGLTSRPVWTAWVDRMTAELRAAMDEARFTAARAAGAVLGRERAAALALAAVEGLVDD